MFRNTDQRNNLELLLTSVLLLLLQKEVHQNIYETKRLFDVDDEEIFHLLTNFFVVAMDTECKQMEVVDWRIESIGVQTWLQSCLQQMS